MSEKSEIEQLDRPTFLRHMEAALPPAILEQSKKIATMKVEAALMEQQLGKVVEQLNKLKTELLMYAEDIGAEEVALRDMIAKFVKSRSE